MFIVGNKIKVRLKQEAPTPFHCPECAGIQPFQSVEYRDYLELFLIPILPTGPWQDLWICTICDYERAA